MGLLENFRKVAQLDLSYTYPEEKLFLLGVIHVISLHKHVDNLVTHLISESSQLIFKHPFTDLDRLKSFSFQEVSDDGFRLSRLYEIKPFTLRLLIFGSDDLNLIAGLQYI